ncbi:MAG: hypothetical protein U5L09_04470 [Bacteroidales bacterium]|nr:hypothetical protein [Bacteroidales bacterium]
MIIPGNSPVLIRKVCTGIDMYQSSMDEVTSYERTSVIDGFNLGVDFLYIKGKNNLEYGLEMNGYTTDFFFVNSVGRRIQQRENTTELGGYFRGKFIFDNWVIEPGMRVQYYASLSELSPEPRLAAKYNASDKLRLKFATGIYAQNLISAHNPRDVVSLFYGFLSGPDNLPSTFEGKEITSKLQHAQHAVVGAEYDINSRITTNLEVYYKNFSQLTALNRNKIRDEADFPDLPDNLVKDFIVEEGSAVGGHDIEV